MPLYTLPLTLPEYPACCLYVFHVNNISFLSDSDPKGRHVATVRCPWLGPSFPKSHQELARHYGIRAHLKNGNLKSNLKIWFLNFLTPKNQSKIRQSSIYISILNPYQKTIVYIFNNHKSCHGYLAAKRNNTHLSENFNHKLNSYVKASK